MIWRQHYLKRLSGDLDRWSQRGLVDPAKIPAILKDAQGTGSPNRLTTVLAILGVVLLGFAAMSFVAANWADMAKLTKLIVLGGGMWAAIGIAIWNNRRGEDRIDLYTEAAVLLAVILFGVAVMLIGQMYHIGGEYSDGLMLWLAGALVTAWLAPSRAALILAIILAPMWSLAALVEDPSMLHWQFVIPISLAGLLATGMGWRPAAHLIIVAWAVWFTITGMWLMGEYDWPSAGVTALGAMVALVVFAKGHLPLRVVAPFEDAMIHWGLFAAMGLAYWLPLLGGEFEPQPPALWVAIALALAIIATVGLALSQRRLAMADAAMIITASTVLFAFPYARVEFGEIISWAFVVAYFGASVWCVGYGTRSHDRFSVNLGFAAFGLMAVYVYFETIGTLLGTATFFAVGGILLIALSLGLERIRRRVLAHQTPDEETQA